jgi:hypothetical protein
MEIEAELGWASPEQQHTPRHSDLLDEIAKLQA